MRANRRRVAQTDESHLQPSPTVDEPFCRTKVSAGGRLFGPRGITAHAQIDVEGRSGAPDAVARGLGMGLGMFLAVLSGLIASAGCVGLSKLVSNVEGDVVFLLSVGVGLLVGTAVARSIQSRFREARMDQSSVRQLPKQRDSSSNSQMTIKSEAVLREPDGSENPTSAK
jgi:hypothetical protein